MFDSTNIRSSSPDELAVLSRSMPRLQHATPGRATGTSGPSPYRRLGKRTLDLVLGGVSMLVALPVVLVLAAIVAADGRSPFFVQERVGRNGRVFRMIKLRSMVADAERTLEAYLAANPAAAREWALRQKLTEDPRVTRFGHFLRRTSLDELPQLLNVMAGHMSLVGPRPMMPSQRDLYPGNAYYALRPGITGLWQVSERHGSEFARRADYDQYYHENLSLRLDLATLAKTVVVVLRGTGC